MLFLESTFDDLAATLASLVLAPSDLAADFDLAAVFATGFSILALAVALAAGFDAVPLPLVFTATLLVGFETDLAAGFAGDFLVEAAVAFEVVFAAGFAELFTAVDLVATDLAAEVFEEEMAFASLGLEDFDSVFEGAEPAKRLESKPLRFLPAFAPIEPFANLYLSPPPLNRFSDDSGITKTHVKFLFSKNQDWVFYKHSPESG